MKLPGLTVLLAEDNVTNQMVATQMLQALGAEVTLAEDGAVALEIAAQQDFDLMLVDIEMPRVSGIDVIRHLRASPPPKCQMPIIALTAYVMREHREPIEAAGVDGIIPKPIISIDQLARDIHSMMAARHALNQPTSAVSPFAPARAGLPCNGSAIVSDIYDGLADAIGPKAMAELVIRVGEDLGAAGRQVGQGLGAGDLEAVRAGTHIIVSVAGAIGAVRLQHASQALNTAAHRGDRATLDRDGPVMMALLDQVRQAVAERQGG